MTKRRACMAKYQVAVIRRPERWKPECADDVPLQLSGRVEVALETDHVFEAVERAIEHNESDEAKGRGRWAVVVEPGGAGRIWPGARVCTPITYRIAPIWWPDGWQPQSPLDVPNCVWQAEERAAGESLSYAEAEATMFGLNRQCMDHPAAIWHVVMAVENEPVSRTVSQDARGTETTAESYQMHVVRPADGGRGDCSHCPAHDFQCAKADWSSQVQTISARHSRATGAVPT
jgi:hypothetical protein